MRMRNSYVIDDVTVSILLLLNLLINTISRSILSIDAVGYSYHHPLPPPSVKGSRI